MEIIDALIVTLGLDTSGFKKGETEQSAAQKKMRDDSARTSKQLQDQGKKVADSIGQIRDQVIGLFAVFTAGRGLAEFVADLTRSDAALGRTAKNIGVSADQLSAWQGAAARAGGSAEGITGSMRALTNGFQQLFLTGESGALPYFRRLGVEMTKFVDHRGNITDMTGLLLSLSDAFKRQGVSAAEAQTIGAGIGLNEDTVNVLLQGRDALAAYLAESEKLGHTNKADAEAAQQRQTAFRGLAQASEDLGRKLLTAATPAILTITRGLTLLSEWAAKHRPMVEALFTGLGVAVVGFAAVLAAPLAGIAALTVSLTAAVAGVALLYDDWRTWTEGGKSAFAGFWQFFADKWASISTTVQPAIDALKTYWGDLWKTIKDGLVAVHDLFFGTSQQIRMSWGQLFTDLGSDALALVDAVKKLGPLLLDAVKIAFGTAFAWLEDRFDAIKGAITGMFSQSGAAAVGPAGGGGVGAQADIDKFVALGWTRAQAAGIAASLQRESAGNPSAVGDKGAAYGLFQWHKPRQDAFKAWAGHDIRDSTRDEQIAFANYELRYGSEQGAGAKLAGATDAATAGAIVSRDYERPADVNGEASARGALAAALAAGPTPDAGLATGAAARLSSNTTNNTSTGGNSVNSQVSIGTVNVNAPNATDARGVAAGLGGAIQEFSWVGQANFGLAG